MPPVSRKGIQVEVDDQGRTVHTFRQSTLGELDLCPERGRLTLTGNMPKVETDAAALGTGAHYGMECAIQAILDGEAPLGPNRIFELMVEEFDRISQLDGFEWKKYKRPKVVKYLESIAWVFFEEIYCDLDPIGIEIPFNGLVIYEDDERVIKINGTIDLLDKKMGAADWKTAGDARKYKAGWGGEAWKLERWEIQPTVYIQALLLLGYLDPDADQWPFTYLPFGLGSKGEVSFEPLTVYRHQGDLDWLVEKCLSYAKQVEAEVEPWPKQDNHALCSEKWCPAWDQCKGAHYEDGWPKPSLPRQ